MVDSRWIRNCAPGGIPIPVMQTCDKIPQEAHFLERETDVNPEIVQRFADLAELIEAHSAEAETTGKLSQAVVQALLEAGIARLYLPKSLGGLEADPLTVAAVTATIARSDTAAAWFVMVANASRLGAQYWPAELVESLWIDDPDLVIAASGNKPFSATPVTGGVLVDGVNSFVSGCHHARWLLSPAHLDGAMAMVLVPMDQCSIVDNWRSLGMRGTGSNDVAAEAVFVPETHVISMQNPPGARNRHYQSALYLCPSRILFATYVPVTLVLAEAALAELSALAQGKTAYADDRKLKHRSIAQIKYAKGLATYRASSEYFYSALNDAWLRAQQGVSASAQHKADLYLAGTHAAQSAAQVVRWVADAAGTSVIYSDQPLERIFRDMETLRHHGFVSESRYGSVTQVLWDATLDYQLLLR
jgi:alkylation response protein AidB-like acyl-CoA dehydrogenase